MVSLCCQPRQRSETKCSQVVSFQTCAYILVSVNGKIRASGNLCNALASYHSRPESCARPGMPRHRGNKLKYQILRSNAFKSTHRIASANAALRLRGIDCAKLRLEPIDTRAMAASLLWGDTGLIFLWENVANWKQRDPRGLDIALWFDTDLCGLCYATPRKSLLCVKVILLEGKPDAQHALKGLVAPLMLTAIESYGITLGCVEIEVEKPAPGAVEWYQNLGFGYDLTGRLVISIAQ